MTTIVTIFIFYIYSLWGAFSKITKCMMLGDMTDRAFVTSTTLK